jgi:hypothetical protein
VLDTTALPVAAVADELEAWIGEQRQRPELSRPFGP